ncbi:MAG: hypothetical protein RL562_3282, partial [Planctomycetota bacterium]
MLEPASSVRNSGRTLCGTSLLDPPKAGRGGRLFLPTLAYPTEPMAKQLAFETDAREAVLRGAQKLARAVIST